MARITVEDCQQQVDNRFLLVQMAIKRVHQYREGYDPLVKSKNKEVVTSLREIADWQGSSLRTQSATCCSNRTSAGSVVPRATGRGG